MIRKSYGAVVQWGVAGQNLPHLKAIIVRSANNDVYTELTNPDGGICPWMFEYCAPMMHGFNFASPLAELTGGAGPPYG
jgi:predicted acyl esterase